MNFKRLTTGLVLLSFSNFVNASPPSETQACDTQEAGLVSVIMGSVVNPLQSNSCVDGVAGGVFSSEGNRASITNLSNDLNSKDSNNNGAFLGESNLKGLPAGDHFAGWSVWGSFSWTDFEGDNKPEDPTATGVTEFIYDADTMSGLVGADRFVTDRLILGAAFGYEDTDVFTFFNGGNTETDGFTIAPYAAYLINDTFSVDVAFGYSSLEHDTDRIQLGTGATLVGEFDSDRYFASTNLNGATTHNNWYLSGRVGYLYSYEEQDGYTETGGAAGGTTPRTVGDRNVHISQLVVGGEASYSFGRQEPYFGLTYVKDLSRGIGRNAGGLPGGVAADFSDDDEFQVTAGLRWFATLFTAAIDVNHTFTRDNFESTGVMFTLRSDL